MGENSETPIEQTIKAIDFELEVINRETVLPGWTKWAIYGAFGAIGWLLVNVYENETFNYLNIAQLYLVFRFISSAPGLVHVLYPDNESRIDNFGKFQRASSVIDFETLISNFLLTVIDLFLVIFVSNNVWLIQTLLVTFGFIILIAIQIYQYWQLNVEFPSNRTEIRTNVFAKLFGFAFAAMFFLLALWAFSGYFFAAYDRGITLPDIKVALLLFAASFLYGKLTTKPAPDRIKHDLVELRRHILFSGSDANKARFELKKIIGKLSPSEFVDDLYRDCFLSVSFELGSVECSLKILAEIHELLSEDEFNDDIIVSKLKEEKEHRSSFERRKDFVKKEVKKFNKIIKRVKFFLRYDDGELDNMERIINEKYDSSIEKQKELSTLREDMWKKLNQLTSGTRSE